jgi:flavin reductase (DIM6/NTAB) family NADH-FMN oxidoreductase RutF
MMSAAEALEQRFRDAMRRTASGVTVLATDGPRGRAGVTVSTFCSLSMQPPSVIACIHRQSRALHIILENGAFTANVLADGQQRIAEGFAGRIPELRADRFSAGRWHRLATGAPALDDALAAFDCQVASTFDFGSHCIVIGQVVDVATSSAQPLVYSDQGFHRLVAA